MSRSRSLARLTGWRVTGRGKSRHSVSEEREMKRSLSLLVSLCAVLAMSASAMAQIPLHADLAGSNEVPPNASPATGTFDGVLSGGPGAWVLTYTNTMTGLVAPCTDAHIHNAPAGVNGPVVHHYDNKPIGLTTAVWSGDWRFDDPAPLTNALANEILAGRTYSNVHSQAFPGGEIRGQILIVPEPASASLLLLGALPMMYRRRA
jgi:hypothetical protein